MGRLSELEIGASCKKAILTAMRARVSMIDGCSNGRQPPDAVSRAQDGRGVALDTYSLAYTVSSLINQLFGKSRDPFWQQAYTNLVRWIIELHRRID